MNIYAISISLFQKSHLVHGFIFYTFGLFIVGPNAVNLTDGLDGLATVPVMLVALSLL